jgi:NADH-ubiquinone oxidoreductase chain 5
MIFIAGLGPNFEYDLRKIIALSTLSQLSLIIGAVSVRFISLAVFHLLTHALFHFIRFLTFFLFPKKGFLVIFLRLLN